MTVRPERQQGLGRGLAALIPQRAAHATGSTEISIARVRPNPRQPRQSMDQAELEALAASIREHGVLQPILVTETLEGYQLDRSPTRRSRAARDRPGREPSTRGSRADGGGARVPLPA